MDYKKTVLEIVKAYIKDMQALDFKVKNIKSLNVKNGMKLYNDIEALELEKPKAKKETKQDETRYALVVNGANVKELSIKNVQNKLAYRVYKETNYKDASKENKTAIDKLIKQLNTKEKSEISITTSEKVVLA